MIVWYAIWFQHSSPRHRLHVAENQCPGSMPRLPDSKLKYCYPLNRNSFPPFWREVVYSKGKNLLPKWDSFVLKQTFFRRGLVGKKRNRKSQKLSPLENMVENLPKVPSPLADNPSNTPNLVSIIQKQNSTYALDFFLFCISKYRSLSAAEATRSTYIPQLVTNLYTRAQLFKANNIVS